MSAVLLLLLGLVSLLLLVLRRSSRTRRDGEPPLIKGWIPVVGKALEFGQNSFKFLLEHQKKHGDIFTVQIAGKYMTFILNPLLFPNIVKDGRHLDFHEFSYKVGSHAFGYPLMKPKEFPGLQEQVSRSFLLLQGESLSPLTESMLGNLQLVLRQDFLGQRPGEECDWKSHSIYKFCNSVMFEATLLTMYGRPPAASRHSGMDVIMENFVKYDTKFPLLVAQIPLWLLGQTKAIREELTRVFLPQKMTRWSNASQFIRKRLEIFDQFDMLRDLDKAAHNFGILWASAANTVPATFWALYHLVTHPEVAEVVRQELLDVLSQSGVEFSSDRDVTLTREQLDKLVYLDSAVKESLRLSSASMNVRVAMDDFSLRLDGERSVAVRKGDVVTLFPQITHMDPEIYEEPETYRFDRFVQDGKEKKNFYKDGRKLKYYLMPFGSGSSKCPGRYFAVYEIKQFLCLVLLHLDLQLEEGQGGAALDPGRAGLGILWPSADVRFRYRLRAVPPGPTAQ
ncbi:cytochrome P450 7B1 isoform X1 [Pleuronectes platessa]|uniref:cytochrome P450 7B1 isoform X1 n=2 Tax=Pleuronectes platessa TaxID=8262 RepID=UPI00232A5B2F|nr:cytochrome P450 7B1 isoform X1 [Pleuronectes platessa]